MKKNLKIQIAFFSALNFLFFGFAQENKQENETVSKDIIIIEPISKHDLNPQTTSFASDVQILTGLYEGLFSYNPISLEPQSAICTEYKVSRDKKRMTFILRQDAYFSNGEKITANSVRDSWLHLLSTPNAPYSSLLDIIRGAQDFRLGKGSEENVEIYATDDYSLSVYFTMPANYFPKILCHSAFSVIHRIPTVYSGSYYLYDRTENSLILKKNPYYWDEKNVPTQTISFYQSNDADENAFYFNTGVADWVSADIKTEKVLNKNSFQMSAEFATAYYFFKLSSKKNKNQQNFYAWDYSEFRNAILEAIPWDVLRSGALVAAPTLVFPIGDYPEIDGFSYTDNIEAKKMMNDARKKYGIQQDEILDLRFDISENSLSEEKQLALKNAFEPLGVNLIINSFPPSQYFSNVSNSQSDLFYYTWIGDFADPLAFLTLFQSDSTLNDSGFNNLEYDKLLEKAAEADSSSRSAILAQAETILLDSGMVIPIYHPISFNVIDTTEIGGWSVNEFDLHPLKYLYKKEKKLNIQNLVLKD